MKKILKGVCMMAVVALAFSSCKKQEEQKGIRIIGTAPITVVDQSEDRAWVGPNGGTNFFEKDDQIMVYNLSTEDPTLTNYGIYWTAQAGHTVPWKYSSGTVVNHQPIEQMLLAFYPAEIVNNARLWEGNNEAMFEIVDHQTYRKIGGQVVPSKGSMAMASKDVLSANVDEQVFDFQSIMGYLRVGLKSATGKTVTSIVYEDNMFNVTGRVHLKLQEVDPDLLMDLLNNYDPTNATYLASLNEYIQRSGYYVDDANIALKGKTITLDCGDGVKLNANNPEYFLITLRPLAAWNGYKLTINFSDGTHADYENPNNRKISPNTIRPVDFNNIDNYIQ